jgi:GNAT superfamily N-acetyltransferase
MMTEVTVESTHTPQDIRAEHLNGEDLKIAASLLYQAYHDDPVFLEIFKGDKPDYEQRLRSLIREELAVFWQTKQPMIGLFAGETMVGVACLNSPDEGFDSSRFWHWRLKMLLSAGYVSTKQMIEKEKIIAEAVPLSVYHMLSFIAIHPLHQHHGYGHYIMAAINDLLAHHETSEGVVVFATTEKYREFFTDVGYQFVKDITVGRVSGALMVHYKDNQ